MSDKDIDLNEAIRRMKEYSRKHGHEARKQTPAPVTAKGVIAGKAKDIK